MSEGLCARGCVCLCDSPLCGRTSMGPSDGSQGGSCHGNRGCHLIPPVLGCPTMLQTFLFPTVFIYLLLRFCFHKNKTCSLVFILPFFSISFSHSFFHLFFTSCSSVLLILPLLFLCCTSGGTKLESSFQDVYFCLYLRLDVSALMDFMFQGNDTWGSFKAPSLILRTHTHTHTTH